MTLLTAGLLVFALTHLYPAVFPKHRNALESRLGNNPYRGLFSVVIVISLVLIVLGWRSAAPVYGYTPPFAGGPVTAIVVLVAFVLFVASQTRNNIRRYTRHPQMLAVILWSLSHLLVNGETRSIAVVWWPRRLGRAGNDLLQPAR